MSQLDPETARLIDEEAERAEATRGDPYPPGVVAERRNRSRSSVYSVRLTDDEIAAIQRHAQAAGVPASTLVRSWIVRHLTDSGERQPVEPAVRDAIRTEVRTAVRDALREIA